MQRHSRFAEKTTFEDEDEVDPCLKNLVEIVYDGDYKKLVEVVIKTILEAPRNHVYLKVALDEHLKAILRISDVYCLALEVDGKRVYEFGVDKGKLPKRFPKSKYLGFKENYLFFAGKKVLVGNGHFKKAIEYISRTLDLDTHACGIYLGTVVICICEAARFRPIFVEFKKEDYQVLLAWMWMLINDWEKISAVARKDREPYVAPKVLDEQVLKELIKNSGWCADNVSILHQHQDLEKPRAHSQEAEAASTLASSGQIEEAATRVGGGFPLLNVGSVQDLFTNARSRSGLSRAELGKKLKLTPNQVGGYETGKDKNRPKNPVLKKLNDMYSLKLCW